jgi:hypothetical protein
MTALHLSRGSFFEALGSAFVGFQFWHKSSNKHSVLSIQSAGTESFLRWCFKKRVLDSASSVSHFRAKAC